jgi:hypothetical protein
MSRSYWLTPEQVEYIRAELARGKSHADIAANVGTGVDRSVVSRIAQGKRRTNGLRCGCLKCPKCRNRDASERYRARKRMEAA